MKNLIPKRRFEEFKNSDPWEQRKLGEFGKATGGTSIESEFSETGRYKVISIGSYSETSTYTDQGIRADKTNKTESRILNKDDLTMILNDKTTSGNIIGRVLLIDADNTYVYNQRTERIEVNKNEYEPQFLYQLLNADNIRKKIIRASQGNTQIYVNWSAISELEYFVPLSKSEQKQIGNFFHNLDKLITLHQRKLDKLKETKSAYLSEMFPKEGEVYPKRRFAGFTDPWEQRKLEELDFIISDGNYGELYPKANELLSEGVPFIRVNNLVDGYLVHKDLVYISEKQHSVLTSGHLKANDILITTRGEIGKIALVDSSFENANINAQICLIRTQENMASKYLHQYLQTNLSQMEITSFQTGSALKQLPKKRLGDITINYPSLMEEQIQIGNFFTNLDNLITLHQRKLDKLQAFKQAYLSEMFV